MTDLGLGRDTIIGIALIGIAELLFFAISPARDTFWAFNIALFLLLVSRPVITWIILKYFTKSPESEGALQLWAKMKKEAEILSFGYPLEYIPKRMVIAPSLGYFLVEFNKLDLNYRHGLDALRLISFEGTVVFDYSAGKIYQIYSGTPIRQAMKFMKEYDIWMEKERRKYIEVPSEISEKTIRYGSGNKI